MGDEFNRKVSFKGISKETEEPREGEFFLRTSLMTCPVCTKKLGNYYEAILQVRGHKKERLGSVVDFLVKEVDSAPSRDIFITRTDKVREGYNLLLSNKQYARTISKRATERFGGTLKETSHLVGMKKGNELYRITVSIRIPGFEIGDVLGVGDNFFLVKQIKTDIAALLDIKTGSLRKSKISDIEDSVVYEYEKDVKAADVLYREGDTAYILDPFDFKEKAVKDLGKAKTLRVVRANEEIFVIPENQS